MLYINWWTSFLNEWANLAETGAPIEAKPPLAPTTTAIKHPPEEKYHYLTQYGTQILCLLHAQEGCLYLSQNFAPLIGTAPDDYLGEAFYNLIHTDSRARLKDMLANAAYEQPLRCKLQRGDRKWYWHQLRIYPKQEGAPGEFVCIIDDIHESILTQNTLQKAKLEAELALRARSEFLSNMSHELRTPLNAVIGFSQIIESGMFGKIENPQYIEYVKHIQESGYDLLAKIEDLLEIANIDAGRVTLEYSEVPVSDILKHVNKLQKRHAETAQVSLNIGRVPADVLLYADRLKLQHILSHLTANAIKFSHKDGQVTLACEKTEGGQVNITISDTGVGMPDDKLAAITHALNKDNCWTAESSRSIGLGLALSREFVAMHGGQLSIASRAGTGTTVTISLPESCVRSALLKTANYLQLVN